MVNLEYGYVEQYDIETVIARGDNAGQNTGGALLQPIPALQE
jgi:hypothetical protein